MPLNPRPRPLLDEPGHPAIDPWNTMLDEFEAQMRLLLDNGLEPQLRTRLDRLLPPKAGTEGTSMFPIGDNPTPVAGHVGKSAPAGTSDRGLYRGLQLSGESATSGSTAQTRDLDPMVLAGVLVVCRQFERFKLTADQHGAIARLKDWLMSQMSALKGAA